MLVYLFSIKNFNFQGTNQKILLLYNLINKHHSAQSAVQNLPGYSYSVSL